MHVKKQVIQASISQVRDGVVEVSRFIRRRKRMTIAVIAAALMMVAASDHLRRRGLRPEPPLALASVPCCYGGSPGPGAGSGRNGRNRP